MSSGAYRWLVNGMGRTRPSVASQHLAKLLLLLLLLRLLQSAKPLAVVHDAKGRTTRIARAVSSA